jgi:hypothetical protein
MNNHSSLAFFRAKSDVDLNTTAQSLIWVFELHNDRDFAGFWIGDQRDRTNSIA